MSEALYEIPKLSIEKKVVDSCESIIPGFDLAKFNECIPERRAILDHLNKDVAVSKHNLMGYICSSNTKEIINLF